jgi:hypothetical protein
MTFPAFHGESFFSLQAIFVKLYLTPREETGTLDQTYPSNKKRAFV